MFKRDNSILKQAYGSQTTETKEKILWARFEQTDLNDPIFHSDSYESAAAPPILLVLGYSYGVQVSSVSIVYSCLLFIFVSKTYPLFSNE